MAKANKGKGFEAHVQEAFERVPSCVCWRLKDQIGRYKHVSNPCDFFFYDNPTFYAIECKSTKGASLPFEHIRYQEQIVDLGSLAEKSGVVAGFLIWFIDKDKTVFVKHEVIRDLYNVGAKSIALAFIEALDDSLWCPIKGTKKRVYYEYDMTEFLERFHA